MAPTLNEELDPYNYARHLASQPTPHPESSGWSLKRRKDAPVFAPVAEAAPPQNVTLDAIKTLPHLGYVAGPYRDARGPYYIKENIAKAEKAALILWKLGVAAICPHKNTALFDGAEGIQDHMWLLGDLSMVAVSDFLLMTEEWRKSTGARNEREFALRLDIPVFYEEDPFVIERIESFLSSGYEPKALRFIHKNYPEPLYPAGYEAAQDVPDRFLSLN